MHRVELEGNESQRSVASSGVLMQNSVEQLAAVPTKMAPEGGRARNLVPRGSKGVVEEEALSGCSSRVLPW